MKMNDVLELICGNTGPSGVCLGSGE